ncbi:hypothetical protein ACO0LD_02330 [Undibacterium sp. Ji83W]|uniref:hypothetical protein n=1 Tax=Undibacterium sp. Ji83W TaxID=3413043 RepID=UPI003BF3F54F
MKKRTIIIFAFFALPLLLVLGAFFNKPGISKEGDQALVHYTSKHGAAYGGIDQWAYYGMPAKEAQDILSKQAYTCNADGKNAESAATEQVKSILCNKQVKWPVARILTINLQIAHSDRDRVISAEAGSVATGSHLIASLLRSSKWIEAEKLLVRGLEINSADMLARYLVDAIQENRWRSNCTDGLTALYCQSLAEERLASGFPTLSKDPVVVNDLVHVHGSLQDRGLVSMQGNTRVSNKLRVRADKNLLWLDYKGQDFSGHQFQVALALESEGGRPVMLETSMNNETKNQLLKGNATVANNGSLLYLVPAAGSGPSNLASWLGMPDLGNPHSIDVLIEFIPKSNFAISATYIKKVIAALSISNTDEDNLNLYPPMYTIERIANVLRTSHAENLLPDNQASEIIRQNYADNGIFRAAWALGTCETGKNGEKTRSMNLACWQAFKTADKEAWQLLRNEITEQQTQYAELEASHPIKLRLKELSDALS